MMRKQIRQYFIFSPGERRAVIALGSITMLLIILPFIYSLLHKDEKPIVDEAFEKEVAAFKTELEQKLDTSAFSERYNYSTPRYTSNEYTPKADKKNHTLFPFDPNKISINEWITLGLSEKQATVIEHYKAKGGKFRKPEDILKIFVLSDQKKQELLPYVRMETETHTIANTKETVTAVNEEMPKIFPKFSYKPFFIDVNKADSAGFEKLYGIGPKLAARIVKYREWLGGFTNVDQLKEVYGIADSTFNKFRVNLVISKQELKKININTATYEEFKEHPYSRPFAGYIVKYRKNNSLFKSVEQLARVPNMTDSIYKKLLPYVKVD
ncbi:MAG: helix-hairpin-helix domain-containing protein [Chitinophagales bacterium]|nr:helix-hairpin-helix domain-containing protein [Chitinophagales bacterium]